MNEGRITESPLRINPQGQVMKTPDDVAEMLRLKACGGGEADRAASGLQPPHGEGLRGGRPHEAVQGA
jgi:hypothetical protein